MASAVAEGQLPCRRSWRKSVQHRARRLFCCSCLPGEEMDPLQQQDRNIHGSPLHPHVDKYGPGEKETIQITVEDLGIVNTSFSMFEEDPPNPRNSMARSASLVSACPKALKKRRLKSLSSLPLQPQTILGSPITSREDDDEEEEDMLLYESGTNSTQASGSLLAQPVIHLIPPTPSDVAEDDQFFDINSEESVAHMSGSDGGFVAKDGENCEKRTERVEAEESLEEFPQAENMVNVDSAAEPEEGQSDHFAEEKDALPTAEGDKQKTRQRLLRNSYQVAPLPEHPQKSESSCAVIDTKF